MQPSPLPQQYRNHACRLRQYQIDGQRLLSLENSLLKVVFALDKGADIVEFVYKPRDLDFMWHSYQGLNQIKQTPSVASGGGNFLDSYAGGWQSLLPTYGAPCDYYGAPMGTHGEACLASWTCHVLEDQPQCVQVEMRAQLTRSPLVITRLATLREGESALALEESFTNTGTGTLRYMWGQHPAFGAPFLEEGVHIRVPGQPQVTFPRKFLNDQCSFDQQTTGAWPLLLDRGGQQVDVSRAGAFADKQNLEYYLHGLQQGRYEVVNDRLGLGFALAFDPTAFPYLWVWALYGGGPAYPWYGRAYVLAVEPLCAVPPDFTAAQAAGVLPVIGPGETRQTHFRAEAIVLGKQGQ